MRIYVNQRLHRFAPSHTSRYRDARRLLGHLIGFAAVLVGILALLGMFGGG